MGVFISAGRADNNGVPKETVEETLVAVDSSSPKIAPWWGAAYAAQKAASIELYRERFK
eukprot:XP_001705385.1 Hypothetical protein GL50803_24146 [Giardia lamblia ATCC 50803]